MIYEVPVTEETLPSIIEGEVARAIGHWDGSLSEARATEFKFYYGKPFGNEVEGESQVVSTDVSDTVEGLLPIILNIFTSSDDVVRFEPNGPEDEEQAKQQTEVANYVFYRQNPGFLTLYQWFKDAMIQKNGIVKYWWEDKKSNSKEKYQGLTDGEYAMLTDPAKNDYLELEEIAHSAYDDPTALSQRDEMVKRVMMQAQQMQQDPAPIIAQIMSQPVPQMHDVEIRIVKDISKMCIEAIPPEEFGISAQHNCVSIQDTPFCYHRNRKSVSTLREMGCPDEILEPQQPASSNPDYSPEALARDRYLDDTWREASNPQMPDLWVTECFIRIDFDGDGIAELRHVIMVGRTVWINEETDHINFAALTPIIMPHRWIGRSVAELVMDIQFTKSVIWRQMLNNLYLTNNPRKAVLSSAGGIVQANLDDLLTSRPGGIMREYVPNAIRNEEVPFVAGASFPMLEYMDGIKENRTGVTRYNQGTDADSLNKTARGIQLIQASGQQRPNLIARIFAETGVKDLMRGIVYMLSKYSSKAMTLKLRNKWVDVDPREWKTQFNMVVNVGLGTGNQDQKLQHLALIHNQQLELMKEGRGYMVTDENIFNLYEKQAEAMGFKHPELFVTDPQKVPPQAKQKPPDPALVKAQTDGQIDQAKLQQNDRKMAVDAKSQEMIAQLETQRALAVAEIQSKTQIQIAAMKIESDARLAVFQKGNTPDTGEVLKLEAAKAVSGHELERETAVTDAHLREQDSIRQAAMDKFKAELDASTKIAVAEIAKSATLEAAKISAKAQAKAAKKNKPDAPGAMQ